jgi:hypothetical protein
MVNASPNDKAMAKKETTEIEIVSIWVYTWVIYHFYLESFNMPIKKDGGERYSHSVLG